MKMNNYYNEPTQVKFWDTCGDRYLGGIAYQDKIICGCCGGAAYISEIYESAPDTLEDPIVPYDDWVDISSEIRGDDN